MNDCENGDENKPKDVMDNMIILLKALLGILDILSSNNNSSCVLDFVTKTLQDYYNCLVMRLQRFCNQRSQIRDAMFFRYSSTSSESLRCHISPRKAAPPKPQALTCGKLSHEIPPRATTLVSIIPRPAACFNAA